MHYVRPVHYLEVALMKQIPTSYSLLTFLDELDYTEAALMARTETVDIAALFSSEIEGFDPVFKDERAGRRGVTRAEAVVSVRNLGLDIPTRRFGGILLVEAGQDRKSSVFTRFFRQPIHEFIRRNLRKQAEYTRDVIVAEIAKLPEDSPLKPFGERLLAAANAALESLDGRVKAKAARQMSASESDDWKEGVNHLRTTTYAELLRRGAESGIPAREFADAFFRVDRATAAAAHAEPDGPAEA